MGEGGGGGGRLDNTAGNTGEEGGGGVLTVDWGIDIYCTAAIPRTTQLKLDEIKYFGRVENYLLDRRHASRLKTERWHLSRTTELIATAAHSSSPPA